MITAKNQIKMDYVQVATKDMTIQMECVYTLKIIQQFQLIQDAANGIGIIKYAWNAQPVGPSIIKEHVYQSVTSAKLGVEQDNVSVVSKGTI